MPRIPYPTEDELEPEARERMANLPPLNLIRMFANAPTALGPLTDLGQAILLQSELDPRLREVAILAVARACDSEYERLQHENICRAIGMNEEEIRAAADQNPEALDEEARLIWTFADQIATSVRADEELTAQVVAKLGRRQTTELVIACAFYSAMGRIIETTGVELEETLPTENIDPDEYTGD